MFAIIISEKGGAERRESFDKTEINVGRVQGNDLMLPKGNVSKRHARLLYRDGRFIVTDLKSTNGTYVNGRKIAQATIVREGDKIYIGDFVLRIELSGESSQGAAAPGADGAGAHDEPSANVEEAPAAAAAAAPPPFGAANRPSGQMAAVPPPLPGAPTAGPPPMPPMAGGMSPMQGGPSIPHPPIAPAMPPVPPNPMHMQGGMHAMQGGPMQMQGAMQAPAPPPPMPQPHSVPSANAGGPASMNAGFAGAGGGGVALAGAAAAAPQPPPMVAPSGLHQVARETALGPGPRAPAPPALVPPPGGLHPPPAPAAFDAPPQPPPMSGFVPPQPPPQPPLAPVPPPPPLAGAPSAAPEAPPPFGQAPPPLHLPSPSAPPPAPLGAAAPGQSGIQMGAGGGTSPLGAPSPPAKVSAPPPAAPPSIPASSGPAQSPRSSVRSAAASEGVVDSSQAAAHRTALAKLMERAGQAADVAALASGEPPATALSAAIERALTERAGAMRASGELPAGVDPDVLVGEARRELFDLGPVGPLLEDEYVEEVQLIRHDHVVAMHGKKQVATEIAFTSEAAVARLVRRICVRAGRPLQAGEQFVERRLDHGARLFGVLPPASGDGHMLVIRKPQRAVSTLDELVKSGVIARQMASLLAQAVQGRANVLVTGSVGAGATILLGALAGAGNLEDRVVVLQEDDELVLNQPHTVSMLIGDTAEEGARAVHAAIRVRPDRLVIGAFAGHVVPAIVDAIGDGVDGVLAAARAPTLRHLVARLPADIAATRKMMGLDTAREWLAGSFDLVLEVARLRDGRNRVMRVAEFALSEASPLELRDIFTFTVERTAAGGTVEGSFHPTGVVPRIAEDLVSRGVPLDLSMFKRTTR